MLKALRARHGASPIALCLLLLTGCGASSSGPPRASSSLSATPALSGKITVFAAASLTKTFTILGRDFEAEHPGTVVTFSFGPSSGLAQQIIAGAPADLFASASVKTVRQVIDAGDASASEVFANNSAEIVVAPSIASKITSLADLAKPGVAVALCQPEVPCGVLANRVLTAAKVMVKPVTRGLDVKATLAYVTNGQADAAIVYVTDVLAAGAKVKGVQIPAAVNASTAYEIARVTSSNNPALAAAFEAFVLSPAGQSVLTNAGFGRP